jgi:4-carboxymuconolactone decarboxylase
VDGVDGSSEEYLGRAPWLRPADFTPAQQLTYDGISLGRRSPGDGTRVGIDAEGRLIGPFNVMLQSAALGNTAQEFGASIRWDSSLPDRIREMAIMEVVRVRRCDFEWNAHARAALTYGFTEVDVEAIQTGALLDLPEPEALAREVVGTLLADDDLDDDLFERAEAGIGLPMIYELMNLVAYYSLVATSMRVWRIPLPPTMTRVFETE